MYIKTVTNDCYHSAYEIEGTLDISEVNYVLKNGLDKGYNIFNKEGSKMDSIFNMFSTSNSCADDIVHRWTNQYNNAMCEKPKTQLEINEDNKRCNNYYKSKIEDVYFNPKKCATTVKWSDGTFTVVKLSKEDNFDPYYAIAVAMAKKFCGNRSVVNDIIQEWGDKISVQYETYLDSQPRKGKKNKNE